MELRIVHETCYDYAAPVMLAQHMAHLRPSAALAGQTLLSHQLSVTPEPAQATEGEDAFGNPRHFFALQVPHDTLCVHADMTVRTATLEARYLTGDQKLFAQVVSRFESEIMPRTGPEFIAAKMAEREERHRQVGNTRYVVEPNIKDGKGGLRDLHTLFWIAKYLYRVSEPGELVAKGVLTREEARHFERAERFLSTVRCHIHYLTGRADDRLSFDLQREIATRLGYQDRPGSRGVERFTKHYYLHAKTVGDLTRIFVAALEDSHRRKPKLAALWQTLRPRQLA